MTAQELWALDGARAYMARADLVVGADGVVELVIPTFVIKHERGLVLIDTGLDPESFAAGGEAIYAESRKLFIPHCEPGHSVLDQLATRGVTPADIDHVVLTHDHFDHTGGLHLFRSAVAHLGAGDVDHVNDIRAGRAEDHIVRPLDFERAEPIVVDALDGDVDLFGDGSVVLYSVPGHTAGNYAVLVRLPGRTILLTGDTAHQREQYNRELAMPIDVDQDQAVRAMQRLKQIAADEHAQVWIGHDIDDWAAFAAPGTYV